MVSLSVCIFGKSTGGKPCVYMYLESQKHKMFWSLWEKAVMNIFFGKILFLPVMTKKNCQIKEHCSPTRSKTVFFQHFVEKNRLKKPSQLSRKPTRGKTVFFRHFVEKRP